MDIRTADPPKTERAPPKKKKSARKRRYELHTWVGFHLALIMAVVLATGTVATVSNEIDWLIQDDMRVSPDGEHVSWQDMTDSIQVFMPDGYIQSISAMEGDHFAYRAAVFDAYGVRTFVHVDQWTGEVTGTTHPLTVQRFFRDLHRYLFMPNVIGLPLVTSMAFILAISLYTGIRTSRNWRTLMTRIRLNKGARIAIGDAHKSAGLWGSWFFVVMIVTGVWYLLEFGAGVGAALGQGQSFEPSRPSLSAERIASYGDVVPVRSTAEIVAAANAAYPELKITGIQFPFTTNSTVTVLGDIGNPIIRDRANRVFLDPVSLDPIHVQRSTEIGWMAWLNEIADPLHFGFFGGLPTKLIWFVFGLAMTGLSISGVWLTWKRLKTSSVSKAQYATVPVMMVAMVFGYGWYERLQGPSVPKVERELVSASECVISATPILALDDASQASGLLRLLVLSEGGSANLGSVRFALSDADGPIGEPVERRVRRLALVNEVRGVFDPATLDDATTLSAELTLNSGRSVNLSWDLDP